MNTQYLIADETSQSLLPVSVVIVLVLAAVVVPLVGILSFRFWMIRNAQRFKSVEERIHAWDVFVKGCSAVTIFVAGLLSVLQYLHSQEVENRQYLTSLEAGRAQEQRQAAEELQARREEFAQRTREFNINLYNEAGSEATKPILYHEAVDVASTLAAAESLSDPSAKIARERFERLFWGQLPMLEDTHVTQAMKELRKELSRWEDSGGKKKDRPRIAEDELKNLIERLDLAEAALQSGKLPSSEENDLHKSAVEALTKAGETSAEFDSLQALSLVLAYACRYEISGQEPQTDVSEGETDGSN